MTLEERCKKYRNESRRYKRKYLILKMLWGPMFKEIIANSYDVTNPNGTINTVVDVNDITYIFNKYKNAENN